MTGDMPRPRPPHLHRETTRHGKAVWYVRVGRGPRIRLRSDFGTEEFRLEYEAALAGDRPEKRGATSRSGTLKWLWDRYRESSAWTDLSRETRRQRESIMAGVLSTAGNEPLDRITRKAVAAGIDRRKGNAKRHYLQTLRGLFAWAVGLELCREDPTRGLKVKRGQTEGYHVWTEEECAQFEAYWPVGTRERLAYDILLYTGLRRGDAVRLGRQHVKNGIATIKTEKTGQIVTIPILPPLQLSIEKTARKGLTFIETSAGNPMRKESFGNWFREVCDEAAVPGSAHGLRKAGATRAANAGATPAQLDAMYGWRGGRMSFVYTRKVDRERLAREAAQKLLSSGNGG